MSEVRDIQPEKGLVEKGDESSLRRLFERARRGDDITVGFLGGSITQGAVATDDTLCYAYRVYDWFVRTFPASRFTYVNAGIGATDSEYGAARVAEDLLSAHPDFVIMEFAVNDGCNEHYLETYEGCVRRILKSGPEVSLILMNNVFYNEGGNAERIHRQVARHYGLPALSMRTTIFDAILAGRVVKEDITPDDLHPNDIGHGMVADVICGYLESAGRGNGDEDSAGRTLPAPISPNRYENSIKYDNRNSEPVIISMQGFKPDITPRRAVRDCFRYGYSAREKGAYIEYEIEGSCIAVQFRRTIDLPAPVARVTVDGDAERAVILDANFDQTWGDFLALTDIYDSDRPAVHRVRLEVTESHPDDKGDFYLAGIIVSGR